MPRLPRFLPLALLLSTLQGCCGLCAWLGCVPAAPLVPVSWDSPRATLDTLLAAIRTSDTKVIYEALDKDFKEAHKLDGLTLAVVWDRLRADNPFLPMAGDATIVEEKRGDRRYAFLLDAYGTRFTIEMAARASWDAAVKGRDGKLLEHGKYLEGLDKGIFAVDDQKGRIVVTIEDQDLIGRPRDDIVWVRVGWTWKVSALREEKEQNQ